MALLTLNEMKAHLNITKGETDLDLQAMIDAAEWVISQRVGPVEAGTYTETFMGNGAPYLVLGHMQVATVSAITLVSDGSTPMTLADLVIDSAPGILRSKTQWFPYVPFTVTYTVDAGDGSRVAALSLACKLLVQSWWKTRRGAGTPPRTGQAASTIPSGKLIPAEVEALLMNLDTPPSVA